MPKLTKQKIPAAPPPKANFSIKSALTLPNLTLSTHILYIYLQNVELSFGLTKFSSKSSLKKKVSQFFKKVLTLLSVYFRP